MKVLFNLFLPWISASLEKNTDEIWDLIKEVF